MTILLIKNYFEYVNPPEKTGDISCSIIYDFSRPAVNNNFFRQYYTYFYDNAAKKRVRTI